MSRVLSILALTLLAGLGAAAAPVHDSDIASLIDRCGHPRLAERESAFRLLLARATSRRHCGDYCRARESSRRPRAVPRGRILGRLVAPGSRDALERALRRDDSEHVRAAAAHGLGDLGDQRSMPALMAALRDDKTTRVRRRAAVSLAHVGGAEALPTLTRIRETVSEWRVRRTLDWLLTDRGRSATRPARLVQGTTGEGTYEGTAYCVYVPNSYDRRNQTDLLVVIHGTDGQPAPYVEFVKQFAEEEGLVVLAPYFDWPTFPNFGMLNPGLDAVRADVRLLEIVDAIAARLPIRSRRLLLFGHSQGGAFVHRFAVVHPDRVLRAVAGSSHNFVDLESDDAFPWGLGPNPFLTHLRPIDRDAFLRNPLLVIVGGAEERRFIEPAQEFVNQAERLANERNVSAAVRYLERPKGKHSGEANFEAGRGFLREAGGEGDDGLPVRPGTKK